ncbi:MAG: DUF421 domain-containing protein [Clostridiales bacterium]|nr:DUF421 domain-containing protein [Clostridiales bacterium]
MLTVLIRSMILVSCAVLAMRLMGKRQIGQLQPFELVIAIMIADLAATPMESHDTPLWRGVVPMIALVILHQLFTLLSLKSQNMRAFFSGRPTIIINKGKIDHKALAKLCFNLNDLLEELRTAGIQSPTDVGTAIMETSGKLSVFPVSQQRAASPHDLKIDTGYEGIPLTLILDGQLESNNLPLCGRNEEWLKEQLRKLGYREYREILLCYIDTDGLMTTHPFSDQKPERIQAIDPNEVIW